MTQSIEVHTLADILAIDLPPTDVRPWVRVPNGIAIDVSGYPYTVTSDQVDDAAEAMHRQRHIIGKNWATAAVIAGLAHYIDEILSKAEDDTGVYG